MKPLSRRSLLIAAVVAALIVNVVWRFFTTDPEEVAAKENKQPATFGAAVDDVAPSLSSLSQMGREWQLHIAALPPEAQARSKARLAEETKFFASLVTLSAEERNSQMKERLEALMNDPEAQAVVAEQRINKFVRLDASTRQKMMRGYVNHKSQVSPH